MNFYTAYLFQLFIGFPFLDINDLKTNPPDGIRIIPNEDDIMDVQAWIQGPSKFSF